MAVLPVPGSALDAERLAEGRAHDAVLFGLNGGDDVAHRAGSRPLDLRLHDVGVGDFVEPSQVLILVRGQLAVREAEAAP